MSESTVACPHCQQAIRVMSEFAGSKVACPICAGILIVPATPVPVESAAPARQPPADELSTFACTHCAQPFQVTNALLGQPVRCPSCGGANRTPGPAGVSHDTSEVAEQSVAEPATEQLQEKSQSSAQRDADEKRKRRPKPRARAKPKPRSDRPGANGAKGPTENPKAPVASVQSVPTNAPVLISPTKLSRGVGMTAHDLLPPRFEALLPRMDDIALSSDGKAVASMTFQEPVKTILVNGQERVLRRLTPEEKITRRTQWNVAVFLLGMLVLVIVGVVLRSR